MMKLYNWTELTEAQKRESLKRPSLSRNESQKQLVKNYLDSIKTNGDQAVKEMAKKFDGVESDRFQVSRQEIVQSIELVSEDFKKSLQIAIENIAKFHQAQKSQTIEVETTPGVMCSKVSRPIESVGLYIPAGTAPLPSTVLMLAIPAKIAGCKNRILCSPPNKEGKVDPHVLAAAYYTDITEVFCLGGVQAVGAMAFGTESVPKVDKIFGPGNSWVTEAKQHVSVDPMGCLIDMPAGPSEVLVVADSTSRPEFVAIDLLSQAEHGEDSQVVLVADCVETVTSVEKAIENFLDHMPRKKIIAKALQHSMAFIVPGRSEAMRICNQYAPEHLILQCEKPEELLDLVDNAGSVFVGPWTPESMGDYASGTNHVLPTYGYARACSGVGLNSFEKMMTIQTVSQKGLMQLGPIVSCMAAVEGLRAHQLAVEVRMLSLKGGNS